MTRSPLLIGLAFLLTLPWGNWVVRTLAKRGATKRIRADGPASHQVKSGTPTMGGLYFLAGIGAITAGLALRGYAETLLPLLAMLAYGVLGAFDDLRGIKDAIGVGWLARFKFPWQWLVGIVVALVMFLTVDAHPVIIPISGETFELGWWYVPIVALLIVATSNAVNLADGLDGLAGGTSAIAYGAYGMIAELSGQEGLARFCFALVGVLLAFLWFNVHPARMFMGDTGSLALGAGLAAVAVLSGHWLLLPLVGAIFVVIALSVIVQVGYFKYSRRKYGEGRRVFRMAPLQHHLELGGWSEVQITSRFWVVAAIAAAVGVGLGIAR